ncbi:MAG TPA: glycosyltransferase [Anaerolineae bacterium]|nr:glycosyltransferase [Anaerolineae bacterium]
MKVLFICGREPEYTRNQMILRALERNFQVVRVTDSSRPFILRNLLVILKLLPNLWKGHDGVFVGFYGQPLLPIVKLLTRKPIIFDAFVSTYDTLCFDRKWFKPNSVGGRLAYWLDRYTCLLADKVLLDTRAHADYFAETFCLPREKFSVLYLGYDESTFYPRDVQPTEDPQQFIVFYYGSFLPLQGIEYIIRAAKLLEHETNIKFQIAGRGSTYKEVRRLANDLATTNVEFMGWIPYQQLPAAITRASICLGGHFGVTGKAQRVIAGKTYQFLAMAKPTIVGDNPANRELFTHKKNVYMCRMADEEALAVAIMELENDQRLREQIAAEGFRLVTSTLNTQKLGQSLLSIIEKVLPTDSPVEPRPSTAR